MSSPVTKYTCDVEIQGNRVNTFFHAWISTSEANRIVGLGICDKTFRNKFRDLIECRKDAHGYLRWYRKDVEELAKN